MRISAPEVTASDEHGCTWNRQINGTIYQFTKYERFLHRPERLTASVFDAQRNAWVDVHNWIN
ncbi:hypothetical protein ACFPA8_07760 [Streptomyces ovatisporus]|uniref:Transposase n=1 Tax=Streptomyces ovatisporus TaxID=1128682 RepID=A0ABV9A4K0_9ACTN